MKKEDQIRRDALRRYLIYRMKLLEFIHLNRLWGALHKQDAAPENLMGHDGDDFAETVRAACISWLATLVDQSKGGMDVFQLWRKLFPKYGKEIDQVWNQIGPHWKAIRDFRDNVGFHAGTPRRFFRAMSNVDRHQDQVVESVRAFLGLARFFLDRENKELPEFARETETLILDLEAEGISLNRQWFRRALILPADT